MTLAGRSAAALLVALVASLALNLFVAGVLLGRGLRPGDGGPGADHHPAGGPLAMIAPGARPAVREQLKEHRAELDQRLRGLREARDRAKATLRAEPFDQEAAQAALAEVRQQSEAVQALVQDLLVKAALRTPAELRARWTDAPAPGPPG